MTTPTFPHWTPTYSPQSAWLGHTSFAAWLIGEIHPKTIVELGTHTGYSFFAFCETAHNLGLDTTLYAIDTWKGDEQAGFYGEHVYDAVKTVRDMRYPNAHLLRGLFDDHVHTFQDATVDLLHIDGRHRLEDVTHDYNTWLPKLAPNGIVLFHDTAVIDGTFGVHILWDQLANEHPSFAFQHGNGLGVLAPKGIPEPLSELLT